MKMTLTLVLVLCFLSPSLYAQDGGDDVMASTQSDLLVVAGGGVAGAVLGLSTLSFYDTPSKHISNIWTGAALGIITGVIIVALGHAERSQDDLTSGVTPEFNTQERQLWHVSQGLKYSSPQVPELEASLWGTAF